jgi:formiminotetrahydrofolate cyclodeaminase
MAGTQACAAAAGVLLGGSLSLCLARPARGDVGDRLHDALSRIDAIHDASPEREGGAAPGQVLKEREYCVQVERWVRTLWEMGSSRGTELPAVLVLAARAQHFERYAIPRSTYPKGKPGYLKWRAAVKRRQGERIAEVLSGSGFSGAEIERVQKLVSKSIPLDKDGHMQIIEDATCLVFLETELDHFAATGISGPKDDTSMINILSKTWLKMSRNGRALALGIQTYSPRMLGCLSEAIERAEQATAAAEGTEQGPVFEVPWLSDATWTVLDASWQSVVSATHGAGSAAYGEAFFEALYADEPNCVSGAEMRAVFDYPICTPLNISKVIEELIGLLGLSFHEPEPGVQSTVSNGHADRETDPTAALPPRLSSVLRAVARLSRRFGTLRFVHAGRIKSAVIDAAESVLSAKGQWDSKTTARAWQAFGYCCAALLCPVLLAEEPVPTLTNAVAEPLPTPGGGPVAAISGAIGCGLFEMAASITVLNPKTSAKNKERCTDACMKLAVLRAQMLRLSQDDVHRYCSLLSAIYERPGDGKQHKKNHWTVKCAETPMLVVRYAVAVLQFALNPASSQAPLVGVLARSVEGDWLAGAELLRAAVATSVKNARINLAPAKPGAELDSTSAAILGEVDMLQTEFDSVIAVLSTYSHA